MENEVIEITAQPKQKEFLSSAADICIFGGAAGGGKSHAALLEPLRHLNNGKFGAVIFRRTLSQIKNEGGLFDASMRLYPQCGGVPKTQSLSWQFPSGMSISFGNLEYDSSVLDYSGSEMPLIIFDELQLFSAKMFWFMLSRNRSMSGVSPYIRATCNPAADGWLRELLDWWIGPEGFPIAERSGVLRWFIRQNDSMIWADSRDALIAKYGQDQQPKSITFIPSKLSDNQALMKLDPGYLGNLMALDRVTRAQLLDGNWNIKASSGSVFRREWFKMATKAPDNCKSIRFWDRAATPVSEHNKDPDWTVGLLLKKDNNEQFYIADIKRIRGTSLEVQELIKATALQDGVETHQWLEQEPGSSGVADVANLTRQLVGFIVKVMKPTKSKIVRAGPASAQAEAGNMHVLHSYWNTEFFSELEQFPDGSHDDQVDSFTGAFNAMLTKSSVFDVLGGQ